MHLVMDESSAAQCAGIVVVLQESHGAASLIEGFDLDEVRTCDAEYGRNHKKGGAVAERRQKASYQPQYDQCYPTTAN